MKVVLDAPGLPLSTRMRMAVVVVNHNTRDQLRDCLTSVMRQQPAEVVVVDCASLDGSVQMLRDFFAGVGILSIGENLGYGRAVNRGLETIRSPYVLLLNSDTQVQAGALASLQDYLDQHPKVGVVGPRLLYPDGRLQRSSRRFPGTLAWLLDNSVWGHWFQHIPGAGACFLNAWPHTGSRAVPWVLGAAMAARTTALAAVSGFDETYFMYFEDIDLCDRLWVSGWEVHFTAASEVLHIGGGSTRQYGSRQHGQFVISAMQFYRRRYSRSRSAVLARILQLELASRACRDSLRLLVGRGNVGCSRIEEDLATWRHLISDLNEARNADRPIQDSSARSSPPA